ncbi:MAG: 3-oxoacid CoA-transferase subunit B [Nitrospinota bacterium]|jgi:3-oxoacid CoA-transferase subunit B|nr:3-oxoacid CoA-transferase subunit B [Nitrospinota bacterium]MDP6620566.1 3-oxoacid CoA-transferase subunit B [Nitrospinota bacterium]
MTKDGLTNEQMAWRAARELKDGDCVNLGIGLPTRVADYLNPEADVLIHTENGLLGVGPTAPEDLKDPDLVNASKDAVTLIPGASFFSQADAHVMVRGGHLAASILGAYQVSEKGDLANWMLPGSPIGRVGGAMDLAAGARRVIALMRHVTKEGEPKIVRACTYPLTGKACVDLIITDLAVIRVDPDGLHLLEAAPGVTAEEVRDVTEPTLVVAEDWKEISVAEGFPAKV